MLSYENHRDIAPQCYGKNVIWAMVIAVRLDSNAQHPTWDIAWNQTADLKFNENNHEANIIRVTKNGESWSGGGYLLDSQYSISNESRASFYAQYFLDTVKCSGDGKSDATTEEMWNNVKGEYRQYLSTDVEGEVWKAVADIEGTTIEQAVARYDYIVFFKEYAHDDFMNRLESPGKASYINLPITNENTADYKLAIIIISVISITLIGITTLVINKRRFSKQ